MHILMQNSLPLCEHLDIPVTSCIWLLVDKRVQWLRSTMELNHSSNHSKGDMLTSFKRLGLV